MEHTLEDLLALTHEEWIDLADFEKTCRLINTIAGVEPG